jgi:hypothetical protein
MERMLSLKELAMRNALAFGTEFTSVADNEALWLLRHGKDRTLDTKTGCM